jgi:hypothetical protein
MLQYLFYAAMGRLVIYLFQEFPLPLKIEKIPFFSKLHRCDLCAGVYIYSLLAYAMQIDILTEVVYIPIVGYVLTGMITSFMVHLLRLGWHSKYDVVIV